MMRNATARVVLFAVGLTLILSALLMSLVGPVSATPLLLVTETSTKEVATRTHTPVPPPSSTPTTKVVITPSLEPSLTPGTSNTATDTSVNTPVGTVAIVTDTPVPTRTPNNDDDDDDDGDSTPTSTATSILTSTPPSTPTVTDTPFVQIADPAITKSVNTGSAQVGDIVEFTIRVTNLGNATATNVVVQDTLPSFLEIVSVNASRGDVSTTDSTVRVVIGDLAAGETVTISVRARVTVVASPPNNTNVATVTSDSPSDDPGNNSSSVSLITTARPPARLPQTGDSKGVMLSLLVVLGVGMVAASLIVRRRRA